MESCCCCILENGKTFFVHPIYKKYAANENGEIMNVRLRKAMRGNKKRNGYLKLTIYTAKKEYKNYLSHRFIYECFYGLIEKISLSIISILLKQIIGWKIWKQSQEVRIIKNQQLIEIIVL